MRIPALVNLAAFSILTIGAASAVAPIRAQTYNPDYPVCMQVFGPLNYNECRFTSLAQCAGSASGRSAQCIVNPYFANAYEEPPVRRHRHAY